MKKRIVDVGPGELDRMAAQAWSDATRDALSHGASVFGRQSGQLATVHPDGRVDGADAEAGQSAAPAAPKRGRKARQTA